MNIKNKFFLLRNFIDPDVLYVLQTYFDLIIKRIEGDEKYRESITTSAGDVGDGYMIYGDFLTETLSLLYGQKLCHETGLNLSPTYTCARIYKKGDMLRPHSDRNSCEYSVTIPIFISDHRPSTFFVLDEKTTGGETEEVDRISYEEAINKNHTRFDLLPGDALLYKGAERIHWRDPLESDYLIQFFMHFVDTNGPYKDLVFDSRPYMGYPSVK